MKYDYKNFILPTDEELKERLTPEQYKIIREEGTEPPFQNAYFDNERAGLYVDVVSKYPLFSSTDKYDSGTGWPSFTRPLPDVELIEKEDYRLGYQRIEVVSPSSFAHLGHVFNDGPREFGGRRYCLNSAALEFIPVEQLEEFGYGEFVALFT